MTFDEAMAEAHKPYFVRRAGWIKKTVRERFHQNTGASLGLTLEQWGDAEMSAGLLPRSLYEPSAEDIAATDWELSPNKPGSR